MKLVLFDIDGTLLGTDGAGRRAIHRALLDETGTAGPIEHYRFDGKTDPQIIGELLALAGHAGARDRACIDAVCRRYVEHLRAELDKPTQTTTLMPGTRELLGAGPRHQRGRLRGFVQFRPQMLDIPAAHGVDARSVPSPGVAGEREQLADDLGIGLAVEAVVLDRPGRTGLVQQGAMDRPPTRAIGPEQRAVDVEQDEFHERNLRRSGARAERRVLTAHPARPAPSLPPCTRRTATSISHRRFAAEIG